MSEKCRSLGIPERLFTKGRDEVNDFNGEEIYRRFNIAGEISTWQSNNGVSASVFPVKDDSCNRQKFSESPEDVLYNTVEEDYGAHYFDWGIIKFDSDGIVEFEHDLTQNGVQRVLTIKLEHKPTDCMYPHCEIHVLENGAKVDQSKPKSTKALIRDLLLEGSSIIKYPVAKAS